MGLSNFDILKLVRDLNIPNFKGPFMRDQLPTKPEYKECGIANFNTSAEPGSHWVAYYKNGDKRIYFDSYGQIPPTELQKYLKTQKEFQNNEPVIERNTDIVQKPNTKVCGQLCIYILDQLSKGAQYQDIISSLKW